MICIGDVGKVRRRPEYVLRESDQERDHRRKTFRSGQRICGLAKTPPLRGSIAAEGSPRIGRISTERHSRSCASPQSASCSENYAIQPEVSGRTLRKSPIVVPPQSTSIYSNTGQCLFRRKIEIAENTSRRTTDDRRLQAVLSNAT